MNVYDTLDDFRIIDQSQLDDEKYIIINDRACEIINIQRGKGKCKCCNKYIVLGKDIFTNKKMELKENMLNTKVKVPILIYDKFEVTDISDNKITLFDENKLEELIDLVKLKNNEICKIIKKMYFHEEEIFIKTISYKKNYEILEIC